MKSSRGDRGYFISAVIWTVIALVALVLLFMAKSALFGKVCGLLLIALCLTGQWLRYFKSR